MALTKLAQTLPLHRKKMPTKVKIEVSLNAISWTTGPNLILHNFTEIRIMPYQIVPTVLHKMATNANKIIVKTDECSTNKLLFKKGCKLLSLTVLILCSEQNLSIPKGNNS